MGTGPCPVYKRGKRSGFFLLPQDHGDHGGGCTQHRHGTQCDIQGGVAVGGLGGVRCVGGGVRDGDGGSTGAACGAAMPVHRWPRGRQRSSLTGSIGRIRPAPPTAASVWGSPSPGALPRDTTASSGPNALSRGRSCSRRSCGNGSEVPRKIRALRRGARPFCRAGEWDTENSRKNDSF